MRKIYMTVLGVALAALNVAAQNPEEVYLVGGFNNWLTPANDPNPIQMTAEGDGIYTYTVQDPSAGIDFKIFTAKCDWDDVDNYYGASSNSWTSLTLYKGIPAAWELGTADSANFSLMNAADITGPVKLTLDWNARTVSAVSEYAPALPEAYRFELNGDSESTSKYILTRTSEENPYLYTGEWEIPAGKLEGWLVDNDGQKYGTTYIMDFYIWKGFQQSFNLYKQSADGTASLHVNNWKGGSLKVSYDMMSNWCTLSSDTQPEQPKRIYVITNPSEDGSWNPADCPQYLELSLDHNLYYGPGYYGTINIPKDNFNIKFGVEELDQPLGTDSRFWPTDGVIEIFSNASTQFNLSGSENTLPVTCSNWLGGELTICVRESLWYGSVISAPNQPSSDKEIYLIGAPQGWDISYSNMTLVSKDGGKNYYGNFDIAAGDAMFRFYTELGNWNENSIGYQVEDYPTDFEMTNGYFSSGYVAGKGNWNFPSWPGGMMYMHVDMQNETVEFWNEEYLGVDGIGADKNVVKAFKGGIRVDGAAGAVDVFDLQGRRVATLRSGQSASLAPGIYLCQGQKLLVK